MSDVTYTACPYCSKTFALPEDTRIRELEARCAACVGALTEVRDAGVWSEVDRICDAALSSPDLASWRDLVGAVRELEGLWSDREWNEDVVGNVVDAALRCGL